MGRCGILGAISGGNFGDRWVSYVFGDVGRCIVVWRRLIGWFSGGFNEERAVMH